MSRLLAAPLLLCLVPLLCRAGCPPETPIVLESELLPGNQLRLQWSAPWPQSRWQVHSSSEPDFSMPLLEAETELQEWTGSISLIEKRFFRVTPLASAPTGLVQPVEDFEWAPPLYSLEGEDLEPAAWAIDSDQAVEGEGCLHLFGNTVKMMPLALPQLEPASTFRVQARSEQVSDRQMIGFADSLNTLWYVLWGERGGYGDTPGQSGQVEVSYYQGYFPTESWQEFILPAGRDFEGKFGYQPALCSVLFANETDDEEGEFRVDALEEITGLAGLAPPAAIELTIGSVSGDSVSVTVDNPLASFDAQHRWNLGDGRVIAGPFAFTRNFHVDRDHRITLYVENEDLLWNTASVVLPAQGVAQERSLSMGFAGDVMTGRRYEEDGGIIESEGIDAVYAGVAPRMLAVDLMQVNAECAFTTSDERHPTKGIVFKTDPSNVAGLVNAGVDYASLANNHTFDWMIPGMLETMQVLDEAGIVHNGSGMNSEYGRRPVFLSHDGLQVGIVAMSDRTGNYNNYQPFLTAGPSRPGFPLWSRAGMAVSIPRLRPQVDLLVVQVHSGNEYSYAPSRSALAEIDDLPLDPEEQGLYARELNPDQSERSLRQEAIELGADLVITHHPHILQGLEIHEGGLIAHSMGNFIMDLNYLETMYTAMIETHHTEGGLETVRVHPAFLQGYVPRYVRGEAARGLLDHLSGLSRDFDTWVLREEGDTTAIAVLDTSAWALNTTPGSVDAVFEQREGEWITAPWIDEGNHYLGSVTAPAGGGELQVRAGRRYIWWGGFEDTGMEVWDINSGSEWITEDLSHSGSRSLRLQETNGSVNTYWTHRGPLDPDFEYSLSGWIRCGNAESASLQARYYNSRGDGLQASDLLAEQSGTQDWTHVWSNLEPEPANDFYQLRARLEAGAQTADAWFDDVEVIQWEEWITLQEGESLDLPFPSDLRALQFRSATGSPLAVPFEAISPAPGGPSR